MNDQKNHLEGLGTDILIDLLAKHASTIAQIVEETDMIRDILHARTTRADKYGMILDDMFRKTK